MPWNDRELPLLRAMVTADQEGLSVHEAAYAVGLDRGVTMAALEKLDQDGYIDAEVQRGDDAVFAVHVNRVLPKALREVDEWQAAGTTAGDSKRLRLQIMQELRRRVGDNTLDPSSVAEIAQAIGRDEDDLRFAVQFLDREGLVDHQMGNAVVLTHKGLKEMEAAETEPEQPTEHFPPIHVNVGDNAQNVQIQAGPVTNSQQNMVLSSTEVAAIGAFVGEFRRVFRELPLDDEERDCLDAELLAVERRLASPRPDRRRLSALVGGLRDVALGVAGNAAFSVLVELSKQLPL